MNEEGFWAVLETDTETCKSVLSTTISEPTALTSIPYTGTLVVFLMLASLAGVAASLVVIKPSVPPTVLTELAAEDTELAAELATEDTELALEAETAFNAALVAASTIPVAEIPLIIWYFITADFVRAPKYEDSFPGDPAPLEATCVLESAFKAFCKFVTSVPLLPCLRSRVKFEVVV